MPRQKIFLTLFVLLLLFIPLSSQAADSQTAWVKRTVDGDTLLLTNGERVRLIGVDTPEVHESKKLYRDAERTGRNIKTIKALGRKAECGYVLLKGGIQKVLLWQNHSTQNKSSPPRN